MTQPPKGWDSFQWEGREWWIRMPPAPTEAQRQRALSCVREWYEEDCRIADGVEPSLIRFGERIAQALAAERDAVRDEFSDVIKGFGWVPMQRQRALETAVKTACDFVNRGCLDDERAALRAALAACEETS